MLLNNGLQSLHFGKCVLGVIELLGIDGDLLFLDAVNGCSKGLLVLIGESLSHDSLNVLAIFQPHEIFVTLLNDFITNQAFLSLIDGFLKCGKIYFVACYQILERSVFVFPL
jgi:hypothetical protein